MLGKKREKTVASLRRSWESQCGTCLFYLKQSQRSRKGPFTNIYDDSNGYMSVDEPCKSRCDQHRTVI